MSSVRKDPFAVILLDEFEKAAAPIWDLFLQVFDDGRLTDHAGPHRRLPPLRDHPDLERRLGARAQARPRLRGSARALPQELIERASRPLPARVPEPDRPGRDLPAVRAARDASPAREGARRRARPARPARRGRGRSSWTSRRYEFLVEQGFSPELGARPLKRALEQAPADADRAAIVEQAVPEGDQFLFVSAGRRAHRGRFVDPDAERERSERGTGSADRELDLPAHVARAPSGRRRVPFASCSPSSSAWPTRGRGRAATEGSRAVGDLRAGLLGARRPLRLARGGRVPRPAAGRRTENGRAARRPPRAAASSPTDRANAELVGLLAGRLYVLDRALAGHRERGTDRGFRAQSGPVGTSARRRARTSEFACDPRGDVRHAGPIAAECTSSVSSAPDGEHLLAVSGSACGEILRAESGLHVLEHVDEERDGRPASSIEIRFCVVVVARSSSTADGSSVDVARVGPCRRSPTCRDAQRRRAPLPARQGAARRATASARLPDRPARTRARRRLRPVRLGLRRASAEPGPRRTGCPLVGVREAKRRQGGVHISGYGRETEDAACAAIAALPAARRLFRQALLSPHAPWALPFPFPGPGSPSSSDPSATQRPSHSRRRSSIASRSPWMRSGPVEQARRRRRSDRPRSERTRGCSSRTPRSASPSPFSATTARRRSGSADCEVARPACSAKPSPLSAAPSSAGSTLALCRRRAAGCRRLASSSGTALHGVTPRGRSRRRSRSAPRRRSPPARTAVATTATSAPSGPCATVDEAAASARRRRRAWGDAALRRSRGPRAGAATSSCARGRARARAPSRAPHRRPASTPRRKRRVERGRARHVRVAGGRRPRSSACRPRTACGHTAARTRRRARP